ncbi:MAG: hypothetical protein GX485_03510 [Clostridiales bacterium]|jgi:hypothetical protein|nr:hypothetical protein [Clostridiales bacterium]
MRKPVLLLWLALCMIALAACTAKAEPSSVQLALSAPLEDAAAQIVYTNEELGFSFAIPDSWETENYKAVVSEKTLKDGSKKTTISFEFQGDAENPLLAISLVPKKSWESAKHTSKPIYLGTKGNTVYIGKLPKECPYDVGTKADLYNSMILPTEEVKKRFKILNTDSQ